MRGRVDSASSSYEYMPLKRKASLHTGSRKRSANATSAEGLVRKESSDASDATRGERTSGEEPDWRSSFGDWLLS